jgi:Icc-related predicted phosphoesterase
MIRIAAIADVHFGQDSAGTLAPFWRELHDHADLFLLGGDLTRMGTVAEAQVLASELSVVRVPTLAVLGNHDYHSGQEDGVVSVLREAGTTVLQGSSRVLELGGVRVGVTGCKGFGGGFLGACATDFGEPEMKAFIRHTRHLAQELQLELARVEPLADYRIALLHYAPIDGTIEGEKRQIYPFLGSYLLGEAIDRGGCDLVFHGHAHLGRERGVTPGGIPVRNVAQPVLRRAYNVYQVERFDRAAATSTPRSG